MAEIAAAVALVAMHRDPYQFPNNFRADVHPDEVENFIAAGWVAGEGYDPSAPEAMPRPLLINELVRFFQAQIAEMSDDELRIMLTHARNPPSPFADGEAEDDGQGQLGFAPAADAVVEALPEAVDALNEAAEPRTPALFDEATAPQASPEPQPEALAAEPAPEAPVDAYPHLSPAQEAALDRDGDGKPGGSRKRKPAEGEG